ncbi:hypothetical protein [Psychroserpens sp. SPM9]|uniref:hypothetical protein n=1 Tax=Psychroserpens sp. SPM9 TaxID=2975598 RepID=UPI0021A48C03|nr:hypothetical protein [Psychroserpens sp. SPM9]MDG5492486.1 hypothetical protein [Psychroserpens sp. SPM9]
MTRILLFIAFTIVCQWQSFAQEKINNYKYIIVPNQFDFQKSEDQYQLNSLTKFLFNKYGYTTLSENEEYPKDLGLNHCLALKAVPSEVKGGFLVTKIKIDLIDCKNRVIATSEVGRSKLKDRKKAYHEAFRAAFETYQFYDYKYNGDTSTSQVASNVEMPTTVSKTEVKATVNSEEKPDIVEESVNVNAKDQPVSMPNGADAKDILYAQPIKGGFQVVDTEPKKVMILLYSGAPDTFIVQGKDAVVYKKGDIWVYAENNGENLQVEDINLKF